MSAKFLVSSFLMARSQVGQFSFVQVEGDSRGRQKEMLEENSSRYDTIIHNNSIGYAYRPAFNITLCYSSS